MLPAMWFIHFAFAIYFLAEDSLLRSDTYNEDIVELLAMHKQGPGLTSFLEKLRRNRERRSSISPQWG